MPRFRKKAPVKQQIPTSALPDIIFILLFFFMVATKPRPQEPKVQVEYAEATEIQTVPELMETMNLHVGVPKDARFGDQPVIQAGSKFIDVENGLTDFIKQEIQKFPEAKRSKTGLIMVNLKVDEGVHVGLITDIKQKLRQIGLTNINYTASKRNEEL